MTAGVLRVLRVSTWGRLGLGVITVRVAEGADVVEALQRSIARRTGLAVAACRADGVSLDGGRPEARHYQLTLGMRCRGGGYSVEGELWAAIPVEAQS